MTATERGGAAMCSDHPIELPPKLGDIPDPADRAVRIEGRRLTSREFASLAASRSASQRQGGRHAGCVTALP